MKVSGFRPAPEAARATVAVDELTKSTSTMTNELIREAEVLLEFENTWIWGGADILALEYFDHNDMVQLPETIWWVNRA